jgi:hypothetical protein
MSDTCIFQNRLLEFVLSDPVEISDARRGNVDWEAMRRARVLSRVLLMTNGAHPEHRRRTREHLLLLRVSWTTSLARQQLIPFRVVAVTHFEDPRQLPGTLFDLLPANRALERDVDIGAGVDEYRRTNFIWPSDPAEVPYAPWYDQAMFTMYHDPEEEAREAQTWSDFWYDGDFF